MLPFKTLSVSNVNSFMDYPSRWYLERIKGFKGVGSPDMERGNAVELGIHNFYLTGKLNESIDFAKKHYVTKTADLDLDEVAECGQPIGELIECGIEALRPYGELSSYQRKIWIDKEHVKGSPLPWIGFVDFDFVGGAIVDCKVTGKTPSELSSSHARQGAFYAKHSPNITKVDFMYLVPLKGGCKATIHTLTNTDAHYASLMSGMRAMNTILSEVKSSALLDAIFQPSPGEYWLADPMASHAARDVWGDLLTNPSDKGDLYVTANA